MVLFPCEYLEFIRNLQTKTHAVLFQEIGAILILKSSNHWGKKVLFIILGRARGGGGCVHLMSAGHFSSKQILY